MKKIIISIVLIISIIVLVLLGALGYKNSQEFNELVVKATDLEITYNDPGIIVSREDISVLEKQISDQEALIKEQEQHEPITLVAVGDILIHSNIYKEAKTSDGYDFNYLFTEVKPIIEEADLAFANMETTLTGNEIEPSNYPLFSTPPQILDALLATGFNMFNMATNHSLDYGVEGVNITYEYLEKLQETNEFIYSGISTSTEEQYNIPVIEVNGTKISLISFTTTTNGMPIPDDAPYAVNVYSEELAAELLKEADEVSDVQIVSMHWGEENETTPNSSQEEMATYLASLGTDIILGTHPHVVQPTAMVGDCLVIYSMGNFVAGQEEAINQSSGIYEVEFQYNVEEDKIDILSYSVTPTFSYNDCWSDGSYTSIMTGCGYNNKVIVEDIKKYNPAYDEVIKTMKSDPNIIVNE